MKLNRKLALSLAAVLCLSAMAAPQIKQIIKIVGVGAAVKQFGPQINTAINKLAKHTDTPTMTTKVVPILSIGLGKSSSIGAAQVMGPKSQVDKVQAVAQPEADLFGREIRIRALIPVESKDVIKDIRKVDGVGVSGIVDLKI
jgi:hypothetical protein